MGSYDILYWVIAIGIGYLAGSVPFGFLLAKATGQGDIRKIGSGNIGATNVLRTGRKDIAAITLLLDAAKAGLTGWIIQHWLGVPFGYVAAAAALIGHCYPVWLGFKGGKGVATYIGIILGFSWKVFLVFAIVWLASAAISRYSSLSALLATIATPIAFYVLGYVQLAELFFLLTLITFWRHRENIIRLLQGVEGKIGKKG